MANPSIDWPEWKSPLVHYPKHVYAIGLITIELSTLELMIGDVLSAMLDLDSTYGNILYFSPKSSIARLDIIVNLAGSELLDPHPTLRSQVTGVCKRAKAVMGKRHDYIHNGWTIEGGEVAKIVFPMPKADATPQPVPLETLQRLVRDIQVLIRDARLLADEICATLRPDTWPEICAQLQERIKVEP